MLKGGFLRSLALLAVVAVVAGAATSASATTRAGGPVKPATMTDIKIGVTGLTINLYWDLMVAREVGFFAQNNLNPQFVTIPTPATLVAAAAAGSTNFVAVATDAEIGAIEAGGALKLVAGQALGSFALVTQPSIKSYADLKGKKIAVSDPNTGSTLLLVALLKKNGLSRNDVTFVQSSATAQRFAALQAGAVEGALLSQPTDFVAQDAGFNILGNTAEAIRQYQITAHAVNTNWAKDNAPAVIAYVRAIRNAQQFLWNPANEQKALQIFQQVAGVSASIAQRSYDLMFKKLKTMSINGQITPTAINNVIALMLQTNALKPGKYPYSKYYDQAFLADSLPAVKVTRFSATRGKGVVIVRIYATRASTAVLTLGGKTTKKSLKAGLNRVGLRIAGGGKLVVKAVVSDTAGNRVTKTATVKA
jgi:NitT/TauT family transport system substrate-binding protein